MLLCRVTMLCWCAGCVVRCVALAAKIPLESDDDSEDSDSEDASGKAMHD